MTRLFIASGIVYPEPGGPSTYLHEILPQLQTRGWEVRALTFSDAADGPPEPYPVRRIVRQTYPLRMAKYALASRPLLRWAELVYAHLLGLPLWANHHAPRVVKIVGDIAWERAIRKGWIPPTEDIDAFQTRRYGTMVNLDKSRRAREAVNMDGVIVPSGYLKHIVVGWGVDPQKVQVIYNALPPDSVTPDVTRQEARALLGLGDDPILLTVGRVLPWKGVDHLCAALAFVPDVRLLVAGDGPVLDAAKRQAAMSGVEDRVTFLGSVGRDKLPLYMKAADYVALYSGYEGLSHTLLESLRAGTPVIASDKGGNPEVVQHNVNGLLVPYVNVEALAAALQEAFRPGRREVLAANAHAGMDRFDFARMVEQTSATLKRYL
jgi:glycosyltransferase involved in cell wall biosynthesis